MHRRPPGPRALVALLLSALAFARPVSAQDLPELLRQARIRRIALDAVRFSDLRLPFRPVEPLFDGAPGRAEAGPPDTLRPRAASAFPRVAFPVEALEVTSWMERPVFARRFADVTWAFLQGKTLDGLDTTRTQDLRARLEAHFGSPTQTLAEVDSVEALSRESIIQFEYWFVVNDSIPLLVLDVNGPRDRGLVVATDSRLRDRLPDLRKAALGRLVATDRRAPYVDYWYRSDLGAWFVTGFDGATFFDRRIARPDPRVGRPTAEFFRPRTPDR